MQLYMAFCLLVLAEQDSSFWAGPPLQAHTAC